MCLLDRRCVACGPLTLGPPSTVAAAARRRRTALLASTTLPYAFPKRDGLAADVGRLCTAGWPIRKALNYGTHLAGYLVDPDGNALKLC